VATSKAFLCSGLPPRTTYKRRIRYELESVRATTSLRKRNIVHVVAATEQKWSKRASFGNAKAQPAKREGLKLDMPIFRIASPRLERFGTSIASSPRSQS